MRIAIDPGHGGTDPGAVGPAQTEEKVHTLAVAMYLRDLLQQAGHQVVMTRESDTEVATPGSTAGEELQARVNIANQAEAEIYISIHANAAANPAAHGAETWYYRSGDKLAEFVQIELAKLGLTNRGVKQANFYVLKYTYMPGILVELAFLSNPEEEQLLASDHFRKQAAQAIYNGIIVWQNNH